MKKVVDARKIPCPGPVVKAKKALQELDKGTLEVLVDNEIAVQNLKKLGSYLNLEISAQKQDEHNFTVIFQKNQDHGEKTMEQSGIKEVSENEQEESCCLDGERRKRLVVISSDCMGQGSEELGRQLMKGFLYALTELDELPETILFYNGGAKLTTEGSDSLEDLKLLETQGVEILTCGTCLNHYGIGEKLAVGAVTNMYVIAEKMMQAYSILKP